MIIGVPKEVKDHEARVGLVPSGAAALVEAGHRVLVQTGAGVRQFAAGRRVSEGRRRDRAHRGRCLEG